MSSQTINLNNVKIFRISDLIGGGTPRRPVEQKKEEKKPRRTRNAGMKNVLVEASSFKVSNKIAVHGNKPKKVKEEPNKATDVLWLHENKMKYFQDQIEKTLPEKKRLVEKLEKQTPMDERRITLLKEEISKISSREEEIEYILKVQHVVIDYMRMLDNEQECHLEKDTSGKINQYINKYDNIEKQRLTEEYCQLMNNGLMINTKKLKFDDSTCKYCGSDMATSEGFVSCLECGLVSDKSVHDFRVSYNDFQDTVVKVPFAYKRINRYNEILATLQAKENTDIPDFVIAAVQKEIDKEQNIDINNIDNLRIRYYLKRLSLTSYYEHIPHILNKINGIPPIQIPLEVEEKLREMFKMIQEPFEIVKERECPYRLSFLSYMYVLYKFCELLDLTEYQKCFTLLKSTEKLRLQDKIWKGICEILEWEYIPSI